ncbi:MAG: hypothetical protein KAS32_19075 [Candidatus Peribacteraceae bacterium]|nr:hypothetical protein [Candidatus Peribacteraceae bacterium]
MPTYPVINTIDGQPCFEKPLESILSDLEAGGAIKLLSPLEAITDRQRRFWKGVLLPSLSKDSGDSVRYWENYLKMTVMPDDFKPEITQVGNAVFVQIKSITSLSKKKMTYLLEESILHLRDDLDKQWVTFPDPELRKKV